MYKYFSSIFFKIFLLIAVAMLSLSVYKSTSTVEDKFTSEYFIAARNKENDLNKPLLYKVTTPKNWVKSELKETDSIFDTTKPNAEFFIIDRDNQVKITIHTFPFSDLKTRIPPEAQIARWKQQLTPLNPLSVRSIQVSHSGFYGIFFEAEGLINDTAASMLAWSMQLASPYIISMRQSKNRLNEIKLADYTIKATGDPELLAIHRESIIAFADSFELIDELAPPS